MVWPMLIWAAASAVVSGASQASAASKKNTMLQSQFDMREHAINVDIGVKQEALNAPAVELMRTIFENNLKIENASDATQAAHAVASAAAGAAGQSVEITRNAIEHKTGTLIGDVDAARARSIERINAKYRDIEVKGKSSIGTLILEEETPAWQLMLGGFMKNMMSSQGGGMTSLGGSNTAGGGGKDMSAFQNMSWEDELLGKLE